MVSPLELSFYNPDQLDDQTFMAGFVARQDLAAKILARLGEIKPRGLAQHRLIVGQRGMGKTSLLRRIAVGVRDEPALSEVLLPLSFREEQYNVHNLHVFWCNCLDALGDWFEAAGRDEDAERLDREVALNARGGGKGEEDGEKALALFRAWMRREKRRPLLLLDNLDIIFDGLRDQQWSLRRVLQESGGIVVIGASTAALEAAVAREEAFYDFFQVDVLAKLEHHEILLCLRHMARQRGEAGVKVLQILDRDPARIHVLYDLTGGNPRTLAMLYMVLETSGDDGVMRDLERLLDQATPLYKARVEELAPQTRVVFDGLALAWDPTIAANLAETVGLEVSVVSAQLNRLVQDGVVEKTSLSSTSRTGFQVAERFFNIWYLMRHSSRRQRQRLRWLTEMLRRIYSPRELRERATGLLGEPESKRLSSAAYCVALSDAIDDRELRAALRGSVRHHPMFAGEAGAQLMNDLDVPIGLKSGAEEVSSEAAADTYRKAIEREPDDPSLWKSLGRLLLNLNLNLQEARAEAETVFRKVIELDPGDAQAWNALGFLMMLSQERWAEAEAAFRQAIELAPKAAETWNKLGILLADPLGRPVEAEAAFRQAIELDPKNAMPWNNLGILLAGPLGRPGEAEAAFRQATELAPSEAQLWVYLGDLLVEQLGRPGEAEGVYRQAIELAPKAAETWNKLGILLADPLGRPVEAEAAFRQAIELDPKDAGPWYNLGLLLSGPLGRPVEAEEAYRRAIELDPKDIAFWVNLGLLLADPLERSVEAEGAFRHAIDLDSKNPAAWNGLGILLAGPLGRAVEAEGAYRRAIELDSKDPAAWNNLGILLAGPLGRPAEAEAAFRQAIELEPKDTRSWINLGGLLANRLGRPVEAEAAYRQALQLDPKDTRAWRKLGDLLTGPLGRPAEAEAAYRQAIQLDPKDLSVWNSLGNLLADHLFRSAEAEEAYRAAMRIDPQSYYAVGNLAYLLLRRGGESAEAEAVYEAAIATLPPHGAGLLRAFRALADDNFGTATAELEAVFKEGHPELFMNFRDDLLRILQLAAERGSGEKLLAWLRSSGFSERFWPLYAAYDAYLHGEERLMDVNPEVRNGARHLLAEMTRRPSGSIKAEPTKKPRRKR